MKFKKTYPRRRWRSCCMGFAALADITVGVVQPLTGPASGLGIPVKNGIAIWPKTIAGEKVNLMVLDDATDPTKGVKERAAPGHRRQGRPDRRLLPRRSPFPWPT
jgi:branched-chain amino acid transport system substrate-binding protein